ncbi:MAG: hypothetical protein RR866_03855, partial [Raoultibacter sp.]
MADAGGQSVCAFVYWMDVVVVGYDAAFILGVWQTREGPLWQISRPINEGRSASLLGEMNAVARRHARVCIDGRR